MRTTQTNASEQQHLQSHAPPQPCSPDIFVAHPTPASRAPPPQPWDLFEEAILTGRHAFLASRAAPSPAEAVYRAGAALLAEAREESA